ncbi:DUF4331 family protein [Luteipulveratus flavus]|uniref:DUF4331 family protein n=1 Tax=Luteipulveratus flavus TaxID=3031728 RepID=A0ABT6CEQ9_9MICO|nr:DUF4331 family protein [Luteipulveratus sp. YIM 133296]MDF8266529.1 DUF4331 family protein [Luteipulveratus sp. YIM 133296]
MSHHLDSPLSRKDSRLNVTDTYVFDGETGTALVMVTNTSLAGDARKPGFHPEARYEFRVHLDGSPTESVTYTLTFGEREADGSQQVTANRVAGGGDTVIAEGRTGEVIDGTGVRVWAGEAADPFYLDLGHLGHILAGFQNEQPIDNGDWTPTAAKSSFTGSRVDVIVVEVATSDQELRPDRRIGVWSTTHLATDAGGWRQINRNGIPMIWPLFLARGGDDDSEEYHRDTEAHPAQDLENDGDRVTRMVVAAAARTGVVDAASYGKQVARRLLPNVLPYTVGTPAAFSFAGFNGRALADNAPEVMYGLVTNSAIPTGLDGQDAAETRQQSFPYVVPSA